MLPDGKWDRAAKKKRRAKKTIEERGKLIAAFCSAINDGEGPEGREIFR